MPYSPPLLRSVYILGDGMLFDEIIAHMLTSVANLRVIRQVYKGDALFLTEVSGYCPDVILLTETDRFSTEQMLNLLSRMPVASDLRIIVMSMKHRNIQILDRPARGNHARVGGRNILQNLDNWNEVLDLVTGKQLRNHQ
jgi:hypothetical protein